MPQRDPGVSVDVIYIPLTSTGLDTSTAVPACPISALLLAPWVVWMRGLLVLARCGSSVRRLLGRSANGGHRVEGPFGVPVREAPARPERVRRARIRGGDCCSLSYGLSTAITSGALARLRSLAAGGSTGSVPACLPLGAQRRRHATHPAHERNAVRRRFRPKATAAIARAQASQDVAARLTPLASRRTNRLDGAQGRACWRPGGSDPLPACGRVR
jgi:hypothetical protein